jgi:hypothetical protein
MSENAQCIMALPLRNGNQYESLKMHVLTLMAAHPQRGAFLCRVSTLARHFLTSIVV